MNRLLRALRCLPLAALPAVAAEPIDYEMVHRIREEAFRNSQVMETARHLTDHIGPRLSGSPGLMKANEWTRDKLAEWGMSNAALEKWGMFGRGWTYEHVSVRMVEPDYSPIFAIPEAWTEGTNGAVRGEAVRVKIESKEDLETYRGKLAGKIAIFGEVPKFAPLAKGFVDRHTESSLSEITEYKIPEPRERSVESYLRRRELRRAVNQLFRDENVLAVLEAGRGGEGGTFDVSAGGSYKPDEPVGVPSLAIAAEHFARIARLLEAGETVELEVEVETTLLGEQPGYNTVAEIPGSTRKHEVVMLGAHLDSWHGGTGATDNAAGVATMMEVMRILKAIGAQPKRTIRIALWTGEEQGLHGSRGYVREHFAEFAEPEDPKEKAIPGWLRQKKTMLTIKPEHQRLSVYFNMDNGTGRVRGVYAQENLAAIPIFRQWLEPLHDLGATTVTARRTTGSDHMPFDEVGLPGFQFIQDDVEYRSRTHHSNMDTFERLQREDLMQAAAVIASFAWHAANRDQLFPRKPLPKDQPVTVMKK